MSTQRIEAMKDGCTCDWADVSTCAERDAFIRGMPDPNCGVHAESDEAERRQRADAAWWQSRSPDTSWVTFEKPSRLLQIVSWAKLIASLLLLAMVFAIGVAVLVR